MRLAVVVSHPIQYYTPIFRALAERCDLHVFYGQQLTDEQQGGEFGAGFQWDIDLLSGYRATTMKNVSQTPGTDFFEACDTPEIAGHLASGGFDAVLIMGWYLKSYLQALFAAKRLGIPVLVRGDSTLETPCSPLKRHAKSIAFPFFLRLFNAALYVGEKSRTFYSTYRFPHRRLFFSPHCVDNDWFQAHATFAARQQLRTELGIGDSSFVILFAGKLVEKKRPIDALEALTRCRSVDRPVELLVAGSGELEEEIRARSESNGLPAHLLGFQNQTQMPTAYAAADALVLPSSSETWGLVANEALACGKPVIVSDACGCAPDLAGDAKVGRVAKLGDIAGLAEAIGSIMDQPPDSADIRNRVEKYSVTRAVNGIAEGVEAVLGDRRGNKVYRNIG